MSNLLIVLKRVYFNQIQSGEKLEEYREVKPYWEKRLQKEYKTITFQDGYSTRRITADYDGYYIKTIQHEHFGNEPVRVFAIKFTLHKNSEQTQWQNRKEILVD